MISEQKGFGCVAVKQVGIDPARSVGGHGAYRALSTDQLHGFPTYHWRNHTFWTSGPSAQPLCFPGLPQRWEFEASNRSWNGLRLNYRWEGGSLGIECRSTLPGPLFELPGAANRTFCLHWCMESQPRRIRALQRGKDLPVAGLAKHDFDEQFFRIEHRHGSSLLITSEPVRESEIANERHCEFRFDRDGVRLLLVPLVGPLEDAAILEQAGTWLALLNEPPLIVEEAYTVEGAEHLRLHQHCSGAAWSPIPPLLALAGERCELVDLPACEVLFHTHFGPYALVRGSDCELTLKTDWMQVQLEASRSVASEGLSAIPDELAYAGDWSWDPSCALDQLLSLRTWAPLLAAMPEAPQQALLEQLAVPSVEAFRASLAEPTEPYTGLSWRKDADLFEHCGPDVSFDVDWYNGLSLSGLERASRCGIEPIAQQAAELARACVAERDGMLRYYEIFHDWSLSAASMETHFTFLNTDCAHNGLEGLLAEGRLREVEGRSQEAAHCRYLAAKTAVALYACECLPAWLKEQGIDFVMQPSEGASWTCAKPDDRLFGAVFIDPPKGVLPVTPQTRNPYLFAGHFPEWSTLLKRYGDTDKYRALAAIWEAEFADRYEDWLSFYVGEDFETRYHEARDQEARVQAPVFYWLAPEVCLRFWILEEDAQSIEARYQRPLNLAEQILLRAGLRPIP